MYIRVPLGDIIGITKGALSHKADHVGASLMVMGLLLGAYILSPLEEASRDPEQNYGFMIHWLTRHEEARATSYSVRNEFSPTMSAGFSAKRSGSRSNSMAAPLGTFTSAMTARSPGLAGRSTMPRRNTYTIGKGVVATSSTSAAPTLFSDRQQSASPPSPGPRIAPSPLSSKTNSTVGSLGTKSKSKAQRAAEKLGQVEVLLEASEKSFAAFKVLPIDPARIRRAGSGSVGSYAEVGDEVAQGARTCKEAAELMVGTLVEACEDVGGGDPGPGEVGAFVREEDIVG